MVLGTLQQPALVSAPVEGFYGCALHSSTRLLCHPQLILTERAHGPGPGLGTCHLACPLMASASQGGQAGGLSGSQSSGLWLRRGHSEGMGWAWFACPPPGPCPPLCLPPHSWLSMGYWPCSLELRLAQRNSCDVPVLATQVSLLRVMDGGLRLLDPFHSLFLPLGLSPAFLSPNYG